MNKKDITGAQRLFSQHRPDEAFKFLARKMGIKNIIFDKLHEVFDSAERIDVFPATAARGFILTLDRETALYFYQDGDHFKYDGFEMGPYEKGDVKIFDRLSKK